MDAAALAAMPADAGNADLAALMSILLAGPQGANSLQALMAQLPPVHPPQFNQQQDMDSDDGGDSGKGRRSWVRWTEEEHNLLAELVQKHGINRWARAEEVLGNRFSFHKQRGWPAHLVACRSWSAIAQQIPGR
jgi:hypothetical protein